MTSATKSDRVLPSVIGRQPPRSRGSPGACRRRSTAGDARQCHARTARADERRSSASASRTASWLRFAAPNTACRSWVAGARSSPRWRAAAGYQHSISTSRPARCASKSSALCTPTGCGPRSNGAYFRHCDGTALCGSRGGAGWHFSRRLAADASLWRGLRRVWCTTCISAQWRLPWVSSRKCSVQWTLRQTQAPWPMKRHRSRARSALSWCCCT